MWIDGITYLFLPYSALKFPRTIPPQTLSTVLISTCLMWAKTTLREALSASISMLRGNVSQLNPPLLSYHTLLEGNLSLPPSSLSRSLFVSSSGASHLAMLATVQDKVTVCATNDSYQVTRERMTQAAEDTRERGTKVIKPGGQYRGKAPFYPQMPSLIPGHQHGFTSYQHLSCLFKLGGGTLRDWMGESWRPGSIQSRYYNWVGNFAVSVFSRLAVWLIRAKGCFWSYFSFIDT